MNTYSKNGLRQIKLSEKKKTKAHIKSFYKILNEMDIISKELDSTLEYNEDNINDYVRPLFNRDLDSMEKFVVLGKMNQIKNETENNIT